MEPQKKNKRITHKTSKNNFDTKGEKEEIETEKPSSEEERPKKKRKSPLTIDADKEKQKEENNKKLPPPQFIDLVNQRKEVRPKKQDTKNKRRTSATSLVSVPASQEFKRDVKSEDEAEGRERGNLFKSSPSPPFSSTPIPSSGDSNHVCFILSSIQDYLPLSYCICVVSTSSLCVRYFLSILFHLLIFK